MYALWLFDSKGKTPFIRQKKGEPEGIAQNCIGLLLKKQGTNKAKRKDQP